MTYSRWVRFNFRDYRFQPKFWPTSLVTVMLILLILLGFWQLHRYQFKNQLLTRYQQALHSEALPLAKLDSRNDIRFQHVRVSGRYLNARSMLVQNRFYQDRLGFDVVTPLAVNGSDKILLVNRGWVPAHRNHQLPDIQPVKAVQSLTGHVQTVDSYVFTLGKNILDPTQRPLQIQKIDIPELTSLTGLHFYPFVLRLDADQPHGFVREWKPISVMPQRHLGYAVQWFALALTLLIAYFFFSCNLREREK